MLNTILALLLVVGTTGIAQLDGVGIFYGDPQFAWLVFEPGILPEKGEATPFITAVVCTTIIENLKLNPQKSIPIKYPLPVKINQWESTGRGGFVTSPRWVEVIGECPPLPELELPTPTPKRPRREGEREA